MHDRGGHRDTGWAVRARRDSHSPTGFRYVLVREGIDWEKTRGTVSGPGKSQFLGNARQPNDIAAKGVEYLDAGQYSKADFMLRTAIRLYDELERAEPSDKEDDLVVQDLPCDRGFWPPDADFRRGRATAYYHLGRLCQEKSLARESLDWYLLSIEEEPWWVPRHADVKEHLLKLCELTGEYAYAIDACERMLELDKCFPVARTFIRLCKQAGRTSHGAQVLWDVAHSTLDDNAKMLLRVDPRRLYWPLMEILAEEGRIDDVLTMGAEFAVRFPGPVENYVTHLFWFLLRIAEGLQRRRAWTEVQELTEGALEFDPPMRVAVQLEKLRDTSLRELGHPPRTARNARSHIVAVSQGHQLLRVAGVYKIGTSTDISLLAPDLKVILTKSGMDPRVFLFDVAAAKQIWVTRLAASSGSVYALGDGACVVVQGAGSVKKNSGISYFLQDLLFLDGDGALVKHQCFQDPLGDIVVTQQGVLVGCRDRCLYAFDAQGDERWRFRVPGRKRRIWTWPPFPYIATATQRGDAIVLNCWDTVYGLTGEGTLRWKWSTPTHCPVRRPGGARSWRPRGITISPTGQRCAVVTSRGSIHIVDHDGQLVHSIEHGDWDCQVNDVLVAARHEEVVVLDQHSLTLYDDGKPVWELPLTETFCEMMTLQDKPYVACWNSYRLLLIDRNGSVAAGAEFAKSIKKIRLVEDDSFIIAVGAHLVTLAVA